MDLTAIPVETWVSQGLFAILFVWLLMDTRKEAKRREDQLNKQIDRQNDTQIKIVTSLERLENQISNLKGE